MIIALLILVYILQVTIICYVLTQDIKVFNSKGVFLLSLIPLMPAVIILYIFISDVIKAFNKLDYVKEHNK